MKALKNGDRSYARQGQSWDYPMEITGLFDRPLHRQATEGYILQQYPGDVLINRKGEWSSNLPPLLVIEAAECPQGGTDQHNFKSHKPRASKLILGKELKVIC